MPRDVGEHLYGRQAELDLLTNLSDSASRGEGAVTLVEGPAGIGKTRLLHEARSLARRAGLRTLTARSAELEQGFTFGVVRQLFQPALTSLSEGERATVLSGASEPAGVLLTAAGDTTVAPHWGSPDNAMTYLNGLYWLTSNLAELQPLLLIVDDAHWVDAASLRFLDYLARRIEQLPAALVMGLRWTEGADVSNVLTQTASEPWSYRMRLQPLGSDSVRTFVATHLGQTPEPPFAAACHEMTGGNPFLLGELVAELREQDIAPVASRVADVLSLGPPSIGRALDVRLSRLPREAAVLARTVAILDDGVSYGVAAAFGGLSLEDASRTADLLVRCGIFRDGVALAFHHPIQRAAVYAGLTRSDRAVGHRRAAELLMQHGAAPEHIAGHLLLSDPQASAAAVRVLREAAAGALQRGSPEVAARYLHRALAEPPNAAVLSDVLLELCVAEARSHEPSSFDSLRRGLEMLEDPRKRAEVAVEVARAIGMVADMGAALDLLVQAIDDLAGCDEALSVRLQAEFVTVARLYPSTRPQALERLRNLESKAASADCAGSVLLANLAMERIEASDLKGAVDMAKRALASEWLLAEDRWMIAYAANALVWADQTEEAQRVWSEVLRQGQRRGSLTMMHLAAIWRSHLFLRCGSVNDADADARVGLNICQERAWRYSRAYAVAFLVDALVERAELEAAEAVVAQNPLPLNLHYQLSSVARLRCAQGRFAEGLELFLRSGAELARQGADRNPSLIPWRSSAALAALQLSERGQALKLADEEVALAAEFGAPRAHGIALRARALVEEGSSQIEGLQTALAVLERSPARLEHARARADLGSALRRAGRRREAEAHLRGALEEAHRCGALALRNRVRDELLRSGLRPRRFASSGEDSLTPSERRVADMAVGGMTNREIAQSLFVSLKTVEAHLSSVYRKLGVSARWQLVERWPCAREPEHLTI